MDKVLNTGYHFYNIEKGKKIRRPIQLKNGVYGYFNNSALNVDFPCALTKDNQLVDCSVKSPKYYYIDFEDIISSKKPKKGNSYKGWIKLKARIKLFFER